MECDEIDVRTSEGLSVEVKSAAFVQTWEQSRPSRIQFRIAPSKGWNAVTNEYATDTIRRADVYVFSVLGTVGSGESDPLDLSQWRFLVLPTQVLDKNRPGQKTITLGSLLQLGPEEVPYSELGDTIRSAGR